MFSFGWRNYGSEVFESYGGGWFPSRKEEEVYIYWREKTRVEGQWKNYKTSPLSWNTIKYRKRERNMMMLISISREGCHTLYMRGSEVYKQWDIEVKVYKTIIKKTA